LLGSGSPRRRELLGAAGLPLCVRAPGELDESVRPGEDLDGYLARVVALKLAAASRSPERARCAAALVADTVVVLEGEILGKPRDDAYARAMVRRLAGREHLVATRFALEAGGVGHEETVRTRVWFRALTGAQIDGYVATGEGRDKAGAYAIQGIGAGIVARIDGSHTNVIGLPLSEVVTALERLGLLAMGLEPP
jgi:septum formation protein